MTTMPCLAQPLGAGRRWAAAALLAAFSFSFAGEVPAGVNDDGSPPSPPETVEGTAITMRLRSDPVEVHLMDGSIHRGFPRAQGQRGLWLVVNMPAAESGDGDEGDGKKVRDLWIPRHRIRTLIVRPLASAQAGGRLDGEADGLAFADADSNRSGLAPIPPPSMPLPATPVGNGSPPAPAMRQAAGQPGASPRWPGFVARPHSVQGGGALLSPLSPLSRQGGAAAFAESPMDTGRLEAHPKYIAEFSHGEYVVVRRKEP